MTRTAAYRLAYSVVPPLVLMGSWLIATIAAYYRPGARAEAVALHSALEAAGAIAAVLMGFFVLSGAAHAEARRRCYPALGLLAMGTLDAAHSFAQPGNGFVLLRSLAGLAGGLGFAAAWIVPGVRAIRWRRGLGLAAVAVATVMAIGVMGLRPFLPAMTEGEHFTVFAVALNVTASTLYFVAAARFALDGARTGALVDRLFFLVALAFGLWGVTFGHTYVWAYQWWLGHAVRFVAATLLLAAIVIERDRQERARAAAEEGLKRASEVLEVQRRSEERLGRQLARMSLLNQITRAIASRQDLDSLYRVTLGQVEEQLPADATWVLRFDVGADALEVEAAGPATSPLVRGNGLECGATFGVGDNGLRQCVRGQTVHEQDAQAAGRPHSPLLTAVARAGFRSVAAAPLQVEEHALGVLVAARRAPDAFVSGEFEFLRQLAEHVALALAQKHILQDLQVAYDELRSTQQAAVQQERLRAMGQLASGIAHDVNNSLGPIVLYTDMLLERESGLGDAGREAVRTIQTCADDIARTVARMREFYRKREGEVLQAPVDMNRLVSQVVDLTRPRWRDIAQESGATIDVRLELAEDLPRLHGAETDLREALTNLIFNAVDAMPRGGTLTLRTRLAPSNHVTSVFVEVQDTGVGMDEETCRRCVEPFFTTKGEKGTGLGLSMVYGTVQRHEGRVEIDSIQGRGTTIRLMLPVRAVVLGESTPTLPTQPRCLRILCIDDDALMLESLEKALAGDGHAVAVAGNGADGLARFRDALAGGAAFDVVITDLGMPHMDGREVARAIKAERASTPVVMLTGWGMRMRAEGETPEHVDRVASKPPRIADLRRVLVEVTS